MAATQRLLPSAEYFQPQPLPPSAPPSALGSTSSRTHSLDGQPGDPDPHGCRLCPRVEQGPPCPRASSPIHVNLVTAPPLPAFFLLVVLSVNILCAPLLLPFRLCLRLLLCLFLLFDCLLPHFSLSSDCFFLSLSLLFFLLLFPPCVLGAPPPSHGLSLFSVNTNGLHDVMKTNALKGHIVSSCPYIWVVNETKSSSPVASRVFVSGYNFYKMPAL